MLTWITFSTGLICFILALNVHYPRYRPSWLSFSSFMLGWLIGELGMQFLLFQILMGTLYILAGGLTTQVASLGLALLSLSIALTARALADSFAVAPKVLEVLHDDLAPHLNPSQLAAVSRSTLVKQDIWRTLRVFPIHHKTVHRTRNIPYGTAEEDQLLLDIYQSHDNRGKSPALLYLHGGGWVIGNKNKQGLTTVNHLARQGWTCLNVNYSLSPRATFPDHIVDIKRAIAWTKSEGQEFGIDPDRIVLVGGSAGAHLAALAGLTADDTTLQPGFESVDTSVQACVLFYGVYDLVDDEGLWPHRGLENLLKHLVFKQSKQTDSALYESASPIHRLHPNAPPMMVIHGNRDTMVPVKASRQFVARYRESCKSPCLYLEVPGAQHAFEVFPSIRSALVLDGVSRFLSTVKDST